MKKLSRFVRFICETVMNLKLFEHAFPLKEAQKYVRFVAFQIGKHIVKLIIYRNNPDTDHWIHEVENWIEDCYETTLKNNMYFDKNDYFKILYIERWEEYIDFNGLIKRIEQKNNELKNYRIQKSDVEIAKKLKDALDGITDTMEIKDDMAIDRILRNL